MTMRMLLLFTMLAGFAGAQPKPLDARGRWLYHLKQVGGPVSILESAGVAGVSQAFDVPEGWKQDANGFAKRFGSTLGTTASRNFAALALEGGFHEDPRYFRSGTGTSLGHVIASEFSVKTEHGRRFRYARLGSALAAGLISTTWHPDPRPGVHENRAKLTFETAGFIVGFDLLSNAGTEYWPGIRKKLLGR